MISICFSRYGVQVATSSGAGSRLFGGRHFTMFAMYTCSRFKPIPCDHLIEQFAGTANEWTALQIFVFAGAFADEHDLCIRIAFAKHRVFASLV